MQIQPALRPQLSATPQRASAPRVLTSLSEITWDMFVQRRREAQVQRRLLRLFQSPES
jgi:hypothetical protein